jgi:uncharacterized protein YecA (UPF0149 family)
LQSTRNWNEEDGKVRRLLLAAAVLTLAATSAGAQDSIKVGVIAPFSGPFADYGREMEAGIKAYMKLNGNTVAGKKVEVLIKDTTGPVPDVAKRLAQELVVREKVDFLAGFGLTPEALAVADIATEAKKPMIVMNAASSVVTTRSPYIVRFSMTLPQITAPVAAWAAEEGIADTEITERVLAAVEEKATAKEAEFGPEAMRQIEKMFLLHTLDHLWREHLVVMEHLRSVIGLRGYGQRDPLNEYKTESFELFEAMLANLREEVTGQLMHVMARPPEELIEPVQLPPMQAYHPDPFTGEDELALADAALAAGSRPAASGAAERRAPLQTRKAVGSLNPNDPSTWGKVSRNAACPCGSGRKYKHCHGKHD